MINLLYLVIYKYILNVFLFKKYFKEVVTFLKTNKYLRSNDSISRIVSITKKMLNIFTESSNEVSHYLTIKSLKYMFFKKGETIIQYGC